MTGAIALIFLAIGYQTALFVHKAASLKLAADRDRPDTVYVLDPETARKVLSREDPEVPAAPERPVRVRKDSPHPELVRETGKLPAKRRIESFPFDPNTVSIEDLQRLGFSPRQAESIDRYRQKGGHFNRKTDFAKSYVVSDSVYRRLEPFIRIPRIDLNRADSAALVALPGIGGYYASRILEYRDELRGFSYPEQLMDLYRFDREKYDGLKDLIRLSPPAPYPLWTLGEKELAAHPYIGKEAARSIRLFREHTPKENWSVEALEKAGILDREQAGKLSRCRIADP